MLWFRRLVWFVAVFGWIVIILAALITDQPSGKVVACVIGAGLTWIAVFYAFSWHLGILRKAKRHLGRHPKRADLLEHRISKRARIDMIRALQQLCEESSGKVFGFQINYLSLHDRIVANSEPVKLEWESYQTGAHQWKEVPANACYFLQRDGAPFIAAVVDEAAHRFNQHYGEDTDEATADGRIKLAIVAADREDCRNVRDFLLTLAEQCSVFRGQKILIRPGERRNEPVHVDFTELNPVDRAAIILPDQIFDVIDRAAIRQMDMGDILQQAGHRTRTALLFHGPPGTGKTLLTRHLVGLRKDVTTIMLHGFKRGLVREAFRLARYCQPSIVVIEDVDLIAVRRQRNSRGTTALHELLDELDGLAPESRTVVVMTTNRPDVLEPALASRPGRVSQAIEVPLPDADSRTRILKLFTGKLDASDVNFSDWVSRTEGASPAFLEELIRRTILFATESEHVSRESPIRITDEHLTAAMHEIISSGGSLTQKLLGYAEES